MAEDKMIYEAEICPQGKYTHVKGALVICS